jgi:hypothetical protein
LLGSPIQGCLRGLAEENLNSFLSQGPPAVFGGAIRYWRFGRSPFWWISILYPRAVDSTFAASEFT